MADQARALTIQPDDADSARRVVDQAITERVLRNERVYGTVMAVLGGVILFFVVLEFSTQQTTRLYERGNPLPAMATVMAILTTYGVALRTLAARALRQRQPMPASFRYAGVVLEQLVLVGLAISEGLGFAWPHFVLFGPGATMMAVVVVASGLRMSPRTSLVSGAAGAVSWLGISVSMQAASTGSPLPEPFHVLQPQIGQAMGLFVIGWLTAMVSKQLRNDVERSLKAVEEREAIRRTFGQHVSPRVAEALLGHPEASRPTVRRVTVMFLDVRGFTTFSESRSPQEVVSALNVLFSVVVERIEHHGGIVNKYLGDGLMAVFGAPVSAGEPEDDARAAIMAGEDILRHLDAARANGTGVALEVGIGIHSGEAVVGSVGTASRQEYTLIGDTVNLASRIEGLTKQFSARLLVSDATWTLAGRTDPVPVHEAPVKGRQQAARVHVAA